MRKYIFLIAGIILCITYYLILLFEIPLTRYLKIVIEAMFLTSFTAFIISIFLKEWQEHWKQIKECLKSCDKPASLKKLIAASLRLLAIHFIMLTPLVSVVILNHFYPKLEKLLPMYNPYPRVNIKENFPPSLSMQTSQISVYIMIGGFKDHDSKEVESTEVYATIMVKNLDGEGRGHICWEDGGAWEEFSVRNGTNYVAHNYESIGRKRIGFKINNAIGMPLKIVDAGGIPREITEKEINITGGET